MSYILLLLVAALSVTVTFAASSSIGLAVADGTFEVNKSSAYGNATLFDGGLIETAAVSSDLVLHNGARLRLGSESRPEALGLRAAFESVQSHFAVTYSGPSHVQVAALLGDARVSGLNGVLSAAMPAGTALDLKPQAAGAAAVSALTGVLQSGGRFCPWPPSCRPL